MKDCNIFDNINISAEEPTMCDTNLEPAPELDKEVKLNCTAVGPATLSVEWTASQGKFAGLNCHYSSLQVIAGFCRFRAIRSRLLLVW